jgi:hypothetical protein
VKNYKPETSEFADEIKIPETTDRAHADLLNLAPMQLLQNTIALEKKIRESNEELDKIVAELKKVAFTGSYKDLTDTPEAQEKQVFYYAERAAPEDTSILWIDTSAGNVLKFYNTSTNTWEPVNMVWS